MIFDSGKLRQLKWSHFVVNVVKKVLFFQNTNISMMHSHQNCSWLKLKVNRQKMAAPNIGLQWDTVYIFPVWRRSLLSFFFIWIPERLTLIIWNDRFVMITLFDTPEKQTCVKVLLASASSLPKYTERRRTSDLNSRIKVSITRIQLKLHFYQ